MKFTVEQWSPEYASPLDVDGPPGAASGADVEEAVEVPLARWAPLRPDPASTPVPETIAFVDGVQQIDAWVWIESESGTRPGICASYAAGIVRCDGQARIARDDVKVGRGVFSPVPAGAIATRRTVYAPRIAAGDSLDQLRHGVQEAMAELEAELASRVGPGGLVVLDGSIRAGAAVPDAIGYIKSHQVRYLSDAAQPVVARLAAGERTPVFVMATSWHRYSWYMRLPYASGHDWAGIVRCEAPIRLAIAEAVLLADAAALGLPRFASQPHKDPRAPQNLYPIGGLERELRRRLGDPAFLYRELRGAASATLQQTPVPAERNEASA